MLTRITGDLWDFYPDHWIVIPTNAGWRKDGSAVMGRGVAKQAADRWPNLPKRYGSECRRCSGYPFVVAYPPKKMILFPTKPLFKLMPELSWQQPASLELIERLLPSLMYITSEAEKVFLPALGCGAGELTIDQVYPILEKYLAPAKVDYYLVEA